MYAQPLVHAPHRPRHLLHDSPVSEGDFDRRAPHVLTLALTGLEARVLRITATVEEGLTAFDLVGIAETRARETRVRVRSALRQLGIELPASALTVRFDHPELIGGGSADTAIAVAVLVALGHLDIHEIEGTAILGELSLTGAIRGIRGALPMLRGARALGVPRVLVPREKGNEAAMASEIQVELVDHLAELVCHVKEGVPLERAAPSRATASPQSTPQSTPDLSDIKGIEPARRVLEIAAAGGHHLLLVGPPGSGKTMLARRLPGVLPELTESEALDVTSVHSVAGLIRPDERIVVARPFRAPHHTVSSAGLVGGGDPVRPGEVSLAHQGVLFLDEFLEFRRPVLEALREPLENGEVTICRTRTRVTFPAEAQLVAGILPCPCGFALGGSHRCTCPPERLEAYRARLAGPIFQHFDLTATLPAVNASELKSRPLGEPSRLVRERVTRARRIQMERARKDVTSSTNAALSARDLERIARPIGGAAQPLVGGTDERTLSPAQYRRVLRVARTIADLDGSEAIRASHLDEASHLCMVRGEAAMTSAA